MIIMLGMTAIRNISVFVKINTIGVLFILMIMGFIIGVGIYAFTNTTFTFVDPGVPHVHGEPQFIVLANSNFGSLLGILGGGYYLHNITLPIIRNAKEPKNNARDVFIGYFLVFFSYAMCGVMGAFGFRGTYFTETLKEPNILSNCLLMLPSGDIFATIIRFCTFC